MFLLLLIPLLPLFLPNSVFYFLFLLLLNSAVYLLAILLLAPEIHA